tara:strand:+ start:550 stop:1638 length:1089 start_codon:yes stop_codon:yes gene_type:complete
LKEGNNIEKLFRDGFEKYEVDPGDQLWDKIQTEIPTEGVAESATQSAGSAASAGSSWLTTVVVGGAIGIVSVAGYYYFENKAEKLKDNKQKEQLIDTNKTDDQNFDKSTEDAKTLSITDENSKSDIENSSSDQNNTLEDVTSSAKTEKTSTEDTKTNTTKQLNSSQTSREESASEIASDETKEQPTQTTESADQESTYDNTSSNSSNQINASDAVEEKSNPSVAEPTNSNSSTEEGKENKVEKGGNSVNDPVLTPPSNSVDETPGVIEAYKPANVFSPNGDGQNDVFELSDLAEHELDDVEVQIFSRTNTLIHSWKGVYGYWDGKGRDGTLAPEGIYFYIVNISKEGKLYQKKGTVTLIRDN